MKPEIQIFLCMSGILSIFVLNLQIKLHNNKVVLFLVLELEKLSFREAKHPGLVDYCADMSRSVVLEVWSQPSRISITWELVRNTVSGLAPDLPIQKLWKWVLFSVSEAL